MPFIMIFSFLPALSSICILYSCFLAFLIVFQSSDLLINLFDFPIYFPELFSYFLYIFMNFVTVAFVTYAFNSVKKFVQADPSETISGSLFRYILCKKMMHIIILSHNYLSNLTCITAATLFHTNTYMHQNGLRSYQQPFTVNSLRFT